MNLRHVDACPFLPGGGEQLQLNRSFNCSYSDLEKDLSIDTDLEERSSDAKAKKRTSNELVIDLPEVPSAASTSSRPMPERAGVNEANKENLRTIEVSLGSGSKIEQRLVKSDLPCQKRATNFVDRDDSDSDCESDAYSSDSEFEEGDGRCSKCSLENRMEKRMENRPENRQASDYLQAKSLINYLDTNNNTNNYKTSKPFASKELNNFGANPPNAVSRFHVQGVQFAGSHKTVNIRMSGLKTEI